MSTLHTPEKYKWKWAKELDINLPDARWEKIHENALRQTKDVKLRWFQYRIVHRIISTNTYLYKIRIVQSPLCSFCNKEPESISHLFCHCEITKRFLEDTTKWIQETTVKQTTCILSDHEYIFGLTDPNASIVNCILMLARYHIYKQKMNNSLPTITYLKKDVLAYYNVEKHLY